MPGPHSLAGCDHCAPWWLQPHTVKARPTTGVIQLLSSLCDLGEGLVGVEFTAEIRPHPRVKIVSLLAVRIPLGRGHWGSCFFFPF